MPYASLEKIIEDHKNKYYIALRTVQKDGKSPKADITRWVDFFIDAMIRQIEILKGFERFDEISTKLVSERLKIPTVMAKQILNRLLELKLIKRLGAGRTIRYSLLG